MGMMAKMRSLAPWFIITVGGLFVLFMVLSDSNLSKVIGGRSNNVGEINGKEVTYQEYANLIDRYRQFQVKQTGQEIPESQMEQFRDQVWDNLVNQTLMEQKIKEFGLTVSPEEIKDVLLGPNPPRSVTQYFMDSTGQFNRQAYDAAIYNPQNKEAVLQLEDQVRQQLLQEKLANFINASAFVSDDEIARKFADDNIKMNADYVLVGINTMADSAITVTDEDIKDYYNRNKEDYKVEEKRTIKYVLFPTVASHGDTTGIKKNLEAIIEKAKKDTSSFKTYVEIYSDKPYSKDTLQLSQIPRAAQDLLVNAKPGSFVGPVMANGEFIVYFVSKSIKSKEKLVRASHILVKDEKEAKSIYKELKNGADFSKLAHEKSTDVGSAKLGGDLGWFGKGQMVKEFEKTAFSGKVGVIQRPVKSQFGWHIIKVTGKTNKKYVVESIVNKIVPSPTSMDRIYNDATDFQYLANENGFEKEATALGYKIVETPPFFKDAGFIPGLGSNSSLIHYSFENSVGDVSPVFKFQSGYVVAMVSGITEAGYQPIEEIKTILKNKTISEKKAEAAFNLAKLIRERIGSGNDLNVAKEVYPKAKVASVNNFKPNGIIPGLGREFAFAQKALDMPLNKISDPFKGNRGSFIIRVTSRTEFDSTAFSLQKNTIRTTLLNQKKSSLFSQWIEEIKNEADIVDNRYQFYR
ncbi:Peptidyl-prolyl cis-trans isomerase PpiC [hydrothermal vent metagenome]|uniref:Periplasmic chaperone PpiD n=1 Tax=hydrothermal vent metagenome TaxID=652676 RepID=A0A3B1BD54_9ZZZZ